MHVFVISCCSTWHLNIMQGTFALLSRISRAWLHTPAEPATGWPPHREDTLRTSCEWLASQPSPCLHLRPRANRSNRSIRYRPLPPCSQGKTRRRRRVLSQRPERRHDLTAPTPCVARLDAKHVPMCCLTPTHSYPHSCVPERFTATGQLQFFTPHPIPPTFRSHRAAVQY